MHPAKTNLSQALKQIIETNRMSTSYHKFQKMRVCLGVCVCMLDRLFTCLNTIACSFPVCSR
uniref:Uncharacterized protein n=1 Tax=Arundo donax TaxID=35708 RepID=A0A0A9HAW3_ARUDO